MPLTAEQVELVGIALNEASFIDVDTTSIDNGVFVARLQVMSWDEATDQPHYPIVRLTLRGVTRIAASLQVKPQGGDLPPAEKFEIHELNSIAQSMGPSDLYGWEFIDAELPYWPTTRENISFDHFVERRQSAHHLDLFKEQHTRPSQALVLRIWFDELVPMTDLGEPIPLNDFIQGGYKWWEAVHSGDTRTASTGIVSGKSIDPA